MYTIPLISPIAPYIELASSEASAPQPAHNLDLCVAQEGETTRLRIPIHLVLPLIISDNSFISRTYSDYLQGARQMLESGVPLSDVIGNDNEVVVDLFFRSRMPNDNFDCASWACEISRSNQETDLFVRLATAFLLTFMMRVSQKPSV